jgi:hypothetical protein
VGNSKYKLSEVSAVRIVISTKGAKIEWARGTCGRDKEHMQNFCGVSPGIPPLELQDGEA